MATLVKFMTGTSSAFEALETKDSNTLYFLSDLKQIYKGSELYSKSFEIVSALPMNENGKPNTLYIVTGEKKLYYHDGSAFVPVLDASVATTVTQTGEKAVSGAAVYTYVASEIAKVTGGSTDAFVTSITNGTTNGTLVVNNGDTQTTVTLTGVVTDPTYDEATSKLTLPKAGGAPLIVNLGKNAVVSGGSYDPETRSIILNLQDGTTLTIPVGDLVDIYTGKADATDVVKIYVSEDNVISATLSIDATSGLKTENGKLVLDISNNTAVQGIANSVSDLETKIGDANSGLIKKVNDLTTRTDAQDTAITQVLTDAKNYTNQEVNSLNTALTSAYKAADSVVYNNAVNYVDDLLTWQILG